MNARTRRAGWREKKSLEAATAATAADALVVVIILFSRGVRAEGGGEETQKNGARGAYNLEWNIF